MNEQHTAFCNPITYNVYDLAYDFSPEAEAFLQQWSDGWVTSHAGNGSPRDKLNNLIYALESEDIVLQYLQARCPDEGWTFNDPNRLIVSINKPIYTHDRPDLINKYKQTVEVKQIDDKWWWVFGQQSFYLKEECRFHGANFVICINKSRTLLCQLDLVHFYPLKEGYTRYTSLTTVQLPQPQFAR